MERDGSYDAALLAMYPSISTPMIVRNITAPSLGSSVRSTGLFSRVEDRVDPIDYTASSFSLLSSRVQMCTEGSL